jgi:CheY-like chemotaxis protein
VAKVLIVDDEPDVLFLLRTILTRAGHEVSEAPNGAQALERIQESHPEVLVTDLMMPVMDGRELIRRLREDPTFSRTPVILVSAFPDEQAGADVVLRKPFRANELIESLAHLLEGAA